jgi:hypothetical protein
MYVNPYWFGVATTIGMGALFLIVLAIYLASKK